MRFIFFDVETPQLAVRQKPVSVPLPVLANEVIHALRGTQICVEDFELPFVEPHKVPGSPFLQTSLNVSTALLCTCRSSHFVTLTECYNINITT